MTEFSVSSVVEKLLNLMSIWFKKKEIKLYVPSFTDYKLKSDKRLFIHLILNCLIVILKYVPNKSIIKISATKV